MIHKLHIPATVLINAEEAAGVDYVSGTQPRREGDRQAASYANFYIANGAVIFPTFDDARHDEAARANAAGNLPRPLLSSAFTREILLGGGNIHCITQQQPAE